jgi:hypothetical protein
MLLVAHHLPWWPLAAVAIPVVTFLIAAMATDVVVVYPRVAASPTKIPSPHAPPTAALGLTVKFT